MSQYSFVKTIKRLSRKKPFVFFSSLLLIYTVLQLLISYHIIESVFDKNEAPHHSPRLNLNSDELHFISENIIDAYIDLDIDKLKEMHQNTKKNKKGIPSIEILKKMNGNLKLNNKNNENEFEINTFEGCDPINTSYSWSSSKFKKQKIACMVLSLYPRNKILMKTITETYGKYCDGLYFILDDSVNHWFNKTIHIEANERMKRNRKFTDDEYNSNKDIINENDDDIPLPLSHGSIIYDIGNIIQLNLTRPSHHTLRNTWEKVHRMYTYFYINYLNDYDWFMRIDDDVLISMINLKDYLSYFNPNDDNLYYIGHTLLDRWKGDNIVYNAGNIHLVNRATLSLLGKLFLTLPTAARPQSAHAHCMDFIAGNDDPHLGTCLNALNIYPINTMDYQLKNRFMVFTNKDHYNIFRPADGKDETDWYWKGRPDDMGQTDKCCNIFAINDHPWIAIGAHLEWRLTFNKMSRNKWNNIEYINKLKDKYDIKEIIPPQPCSFMYNRRDNFTVDKYYNIEYNKMPHGQRVSYGNNILQCHKCNIGNKDDIYWTNEWDRTGLIYKINEKNKHKFYQISKYFPNQLISTRFDIDTKTNKFISKSKGDNASILQSLIDQALDPTVTTIIPPY